MCPSTTATRPASAWCSRRSSNRLRPRRRPARPWPRSAARPPKPVTTMVLRERAKPRQSHLFIQGDFTRLGEPVSPGVPRPLPPLRSTSPLPNRLDLARWIVDPAHPLTSRVAVNRIWQAYFGRGLVETENDFGTQGSPPSHPELLDWLACEFAGKGWDVNAMHRLIVTSAAYRQASRVRPDLAQIDPENRRLARQSRLRVDAELIRDAALRPAACSRPPSAGRACSRPARWRARARPGPSRMGS